MQSDGPGQAQLSSLAKGCCSYIAMGPWQRLQLLLAACHVPALGVNIRRKPAQITEVGFNPVQRVVTMLEAMQERIRSEGEQRKALFDKYSGFCKDTAKSLQENIEAIKVRKPQLEARLKSGREERVQLAAELKQHDADRARALKAVEMATSLNSKQEKSVREEVQSIEADISVLDGAISAVENNIFKSFLQQDAKRADALRGLTLHVDMNPDDREVLSSFLAVGTADQLKPSNGMVLAILKETRKELDHQRLELEVTERKRAANHKQLVAVSRRETSAAESASETKRSRLGELAPTLVGLQEEIKDLEASLKSDAKTLTDLKAGCDTKSKEWTAYLTHQNKELGVLAQTVSLLVKDDVLMKAVKKRRAAAIPSFLQVSEVSSQQPRVVKAFATLSAGRLGDPRFGLVELALQGKQKGLDEVVKKIDSLSSLLKSEEKDEVMHIAFCKKQVGEATDDSKEANRDIEDVETLIASSADELKETTRLISSIRASIKTLDDQVTAATAERKQAHELFMRDFKENAQARQLLRIAQKKLQGLYAEAVALVQVKHSSHSIFKKAPKADLRYAKEAAAGQKVLELLSSLEAEFAKEAADLKVAEDADQAAYEAILRSCSGKRTLDVHLLQDKEAAHAELEAAVQRGQERLSGREEALATAKRALASLHADCDQLLKGFDLRKEARQNQINSLTNVKGFLNGTAV